MVEIGIGKWRNRGEAVELFESVATERESNPSGTRKKL